MQVDYLEVKFTSEFNLDYKRAFQVLLKISRRIQGSYKFQTSNAKLQDTSSRNKVQFKGTKNQVSSCSLLLQQFSKVPSLLEFIFTCSKLSNSIFFKAQGHGFIMLLSRILQIPLMKTKRKIKNVSKCSCLIPNNQQEYFQHF